LLDGIALEFARQTDAIATALDLMRSANAPAELLLSAIARLRGPFFDLVFVQKAAKVIDPFNRDGLAEGAVLQPFDHGAVADEKEMGV
jgi:hypothetical protein